jgi:LDH2 family malate/lactate/ureidoglycolate dehydrogenase
LFRDEGAFEADVATLCDALRATRPVDPARPVTVAGDPERRHAARRAIDGIPVGRNLLAQIKQIAAESNVTWLLGEAAE